MILIMSASKIYEAPGIWSISRHKGKKTLGVELKSKEKAPDTKSKHVTLRFDNMEDKEKTWYFLADNLHKLCYQSQDVLVNIPELLNGNESLAMLAED